MNPAEIQIQQSEFILRNIIANEYVVSVLFVSLGLLLSISVLKKIFRLTTSISIWFLQFVLTLLLLIASETVLINGLEKIIPHHVVINIFSILWWLISAYFIVIAIEILIWQPVEKQVGHVIPNSPRLWVILFIYLLAIDGILVFVYEQQFMAFLVSFTVLAIIVGFGMRTIITNLAHILAGTALELDHHFRVGDWVKIGDFEEGELTNISYRVTQIRTRDECLLSIPNHTVSESAIKNFCSLDDVVRLKTTLHISVIHAPKRVKKILLDAVSSTPSVLTYSSPVVVITGISNGMIEYTIYYLIDDYFLKETITDELLERIWYYLNQVNITPTVPDQ
jgi:branched-chain amino acid transport system substrate-binding protein